MQSADVAKLNNVISFSQDINKNVTNIGKSFQSNENDNFSYVLKKAKTSFEESKKIEENLLHQNEKNKSASKRASLHQEKSDDSVSFFDGSRKNQNKISSKTDSENDAKTSNIKEDSGQIQNQNAEDSEKILNEEGIEQDNQNKTENFEEEEAFRNWFSEESEAQKIQPLTLQSDLNQVETNSVDIKEDAIEIVEIVEETELLSTDVKSQKNINENEITSMFEKNNTKNQQSPGELNLAIQTSNEEVSNVSEISINSYETEGKIALEDSLFEKTDDNIVFDLKEISEKIEKKDVEAEESFLEEVKISDANEKNSFQNSQDSSGYDDTSNLQDANVKSVSDKMNSVEQIFNEIESVSLNEPSFDILSQNKSKSRNSSSVSLASEEAVKLNIVENISNNEQPANLKTDFALNQNFNNQYSIRESNLQKGFENILNKQASQNDIMNQIDSKLQNMNLQNNKVQIVLRPENLGRVQVEIFSTKNGVEANFVATSQNVKEMLDKNIDNLKNSLSQQGVSLASVNIKVEESSSSANANLNMQNQTKESFIFNPNDFKEEKGNSDSNFEHRQFQERNTYEPESRLVQEDNEIIKSSQQLSYSTGIDLEV